MRLVFLILAVVFGYVATLYSDNKAALVLLPMFGLLSLFCYVFLTFNPRLEERDFRDE